MKTAMFAVIPLWALFIIAQEEETEPEYLTPRFMVMAAINDSDHLSKSSYNFDSKYVRYITAYNEVPKQRPITWRIISAHLHSTSIEPDFCYPEVVENTGGALFRINLKDYGISPETWDKLYLFEPYFYTNVEGEKSLRPVKADKDGYHMTQVTNYDGSKEWKYTYSYNKSKEVIRVVDEYDSVKVRSLAPWLVDNDKERKSLEYWASKVVKSTTPIIRADFLWRHTVTQESDKFNGKCPGYYDFLHLGKQQEDFEKLIGANVDIARFQFKSEVAAAVARSKVTNNNRRLIRWDKVKGGYWVTIDSRDNTEKKNYLRNIDDLDVGNKGFTKQSNKKGFSQLSDSVITDFDATEQFGALPNGMFAWWLANKQGERQDSAPDFIASDSTAPGTDRRVRIGISCNRCHVDGVKPFTDWMREVYQSPIQLTTAVLDNYKGNKNYAEDALQRGRQLYLRNINDQVDLDQAGYKKAIYNATGGDKYGGWKTEEYVKNISDYWYSYQEEDFDLNRIAYDLGCPKKMVLLSIDNILRKVKIIDPIQAGLLKGLLKGEKSKPIRSEHWEELFPLMMHNSKGFVP